MTATMRAVVFHGPGDLRDEVLPVPEPARGEIVVRIDAALTCGTDVKVRRRGHPVMIPRVPTVFGHEFAGTVTAVGAASRVSARAIAWPQPTPRRAASAARVSRSGPISVRTCCS